MMCFMSTPDIEIDFNFVQHHLQRVMLHLCPITSTDKLAEIFTKPHRPKRFHTLVTKLKIGLKTTTLGLREHVRILV